jgi:hypothetical protein
MPVTNFSVGQVLTAGQVNYGLSDSGWLSLPLVSPWIATGGTLVQYRKQGNIVRLRGLITGGTTGTQFATLPVGYVPPQPLQLTGNDSTSPYGPVVLTFYPSGVCNIYFSSGAGGGSASLDGATWTVD